MLHHRASAAEMALELPVLPERCSIVLQLSPTTIHYVCALLIVGTVAQALERVVVVPPILDSAESEPQSSDLAALLGDDIVDECKSGAVAELSGLTCKMTENDKEELGKLSVRLLNCQRELEGRSVFLCTSEMTLKECTTSMDETIWSGAYSQMLSRAMQMCSHFQQAYWQRETLGTVKSLSESSGQAVETLKSLQQGQEQISEASKFVVKMTKKNHEEQMEQHAELQSKTSAIKEDFGTLSSQQTILIERNEKLATSVRATREDFTTFHSDMSSKLNEYRSHLSWITAAVDKMLVMEEAILQEFLDLNSVFFYVCAVILCFLLTSAPETRAARLALYLAFGINLCFERAALQFLLNYSMDPDTPTSESINKDLRALTWLIRKIFMSVCCLVLTATAWLYEDVNKATNDALIVLLEQNEAIIRALRKQGIRVRVGVSESPSDTDEDEIHEEDKDHKTSVNGAATEVRAISLVRNVQS